jgi:hypothetical protein
MNATNTNLSGSVTLNLFQGPSGHTHGLLRRGMVPARRMVREGALCTGGEMDPETSSG